jgi:hypothetical protein
MKRQLALPFSLFVIWVLALWLAPPAKAAQSNQDNSNQQGQSSSTQQGQDQTQTSGGQQQQSSPQKKKGGFFSGLKEATGETSAQNEATSSAGSKSVGEGDGAKIAATNPTAADRQKVSALESFSISGDDLKKFKSDGHLDSK